MIYIPTSDSEYHDWLESNGTGYVINSDKTLTSSSYPMIHTATCDHINDRNTPNYTTANYFKLCSTNESELVSWMKQIDKRELKACKSCAPLQAL
jgi:hypothetical protein